PGGACDQGVSLGLRGNFTRSNLVTCGSGVGYVGSSGRAGMPLAVTPGATLAFTTEFGSTRAPSPIVAPGRMIASAPIATSFPITTGFLTNAPARCSFGPSWWVVVR